MPIRPMIVDRKLIIDPNYKIKDKTKLFIHEEILKYYIATGIIKTPDNLQNHNRSYLYAALNDLGFSIIFRANHQLLVLLAKHISRGSYQNMKQIIDTINEPVMEIGSLNLDDNSINSEHFANLETGIKILNTRYRGNKETRRK